MKPLQRNIVTQMGLQRIQLFCEGTLEKPVLWGHELDLLRNSRTMIDLIHRRRLPTLNNKNMAGQG